MKAIYNFTSLGLVGAAVATTLLTTLPAAADGDTITACIGPGGQITAAAVGDEPLRRCPPKHVQETWGMTTSGVPGEPGPAGAPGISCWDLNENGIADPDEDLNGDGVTDVLDCRPAELYREPEQRTWYVNSRILLNAIGDLSDDHYIPIYDADLNNDSDCAIIDEVQGGEIDCLGDPIPDPCGLWQWDKTGDQPDDTWVVRAEQGYNVATYRYEAVVPPSDSQDQAYFGWENCRDACLADPQCVGASIESILEVDNGLYCKLIAKTSAPDNSSVAFRNNAVGTPQEQTAFWGIRDYNPLVAISEAILSVCPTP